MSNIENIYEEALALLQTGHSEQEALLAFPEYQEQLKPLLETSRLLLNVPVNSVPEPAMRRKYVLEVKPRLKVMWLHVFKYASVSMSIMLLISALSVTGYKAYTSAPGQTFFPVKKLAEQSQLLLAYSQGKKADLQIKITQERLNQAQIIIASPDSVEQKTAALNELASQTQTAVSAVGDLAKSNPKSEKNAALLSSLENIAQAQQTLITELKPNFKVKEAASGALASLSQTSGKVSEIKDMVAVAGGDQTLAKLSSKQGGVSIVGDISRINKDQITVENTGFKLTNETVIKNLAGKILSAESLIVNTKVSVSGSKQQNTLVAEQIIITDSGEVKGISTAPTSSPVAEPADTATRTANSIKEDFSGTAAPGAPNPNAVSGTFILEDPSSQYPH